MNILSAPQEQNCVKCKKRLATEWWSTEGIVAALHGFCEARCEICCLEEQLATARRLAGTIGKLETRLAKLRRQAQEKP